MNDPISCPHCPNGTIVFRGLVKDDKGIYQNSFECINCDHKFNKEIAEENKQEQQ